MKMKKFFSGIIAAITAFAAVAMPMSTANAADDTCTITINHAAATGTYRAYPIFTGNVEQEEDENGPTGRLVIDSPKFHSNLKTKISSNQVADGNDIDDNSNTIKYGLFEYINGSTKINEKTFAELMKEYDPNTSLTNLTITIGSTSNPYAKDHAELIANTLNLTNNSNAVNQIVDGNASGNKATSAFYSAFAEAARLLMIDNIAGTPGTLTGVSQPITAAGGVATIEVTQPGYYLVEYTPNGEYVDSPRAVRRSLVLVGYDKDDCGATINSKDTENITTVDIQFYDKTGTATFDTDGTTVTSVAFPDDGNWAKNVSAGNGDYVNCRVVVTLPSNLSVYDQYYLAVPIMYGYNTGSSGFDSTKSITRVKGDVNNPLQHIKVYFLDKNGTTKARIIANPSAAGNLTESASEIFGADKGHNATLEVKDSTTYTYANSVTTTEDDFKAAETFIISDIANMLVRDISSGNGTESQTLKWRHDNDSPADSWDKFVIEFPVKFDRFDKDNALPTGVSRPGYAGAENANYVYGDDALMKNYITAKAVYSNNPNLKKLDNPDDAYDKDNKTDGVKLYLDTSQAPGSLTNPVGITKETSANIVTYRLRVHATTPELLSTLYYGIEKLDFAIKNEAGQYAIVTNLASQTTTYDEVESGELGTAGNMSGRSVAEIYKITGWTTVDDVSNFPDNCKLKTANKGNTIDPQKIGYANNNGGRFEILGLAPGTYTVVALTPEIKTPDTHIDTTTAANVKDYKLPKEDGTPKTEYKFSFAPTLVDTCTKLPYLTHYAPVGSTAAASPDGSAVTADTDKLIENFNMKWWKGTDEITDKPDWWVGENQDVALMSMRVTYIKKGLTLPVTGGIGTFIFFAIGGAMVIISTVAIVTKFRVKRERL